MWHRGRTRGEQAEGHVLKWYESTCRFLVYPRVIILFIHMPFPDLDQQLSSETWVRKTG